MPLTKQEFLAMLVNGKTDFSGTQFEDGIDLNGVKLGGLDLRDVCLEHARLQGADLGASYLRDAVLTGTHPPNAELVEGLAIENLSLGSPAAGILV